MPDHTVNFIKATLLQRRDEVLAAKPLINWSVCHEMLQSHALAGTVFYHIKEMGLLEVFPPITRYRDVFLRTAVRNIRLEKIMTDIAQTARRQGIGLLALKGMYLVRWVYPQPGMRPMADIDVLCRLEEQPVLFRILAEAGFAGSGRKCADPQAHREFMKKEPGPEPHIIIEVHGAIVPPRPWPIELAVWDRAVVAVDGLFWMSREDMFISLLLKLRRDCRQLRVNLFYDLYLLVTRSEGLDWEYIRSSCERNRIGLVLQYAIVMLHELFALSLPVPVTARRFSFFPVSRVFAWRRWQGYVLRLLFIHSGEEAVRYAAVKWRTVCGCRGMPSVGGISGNML